MTKTPQQYNQLVNALIRNHYDRIKAANELGIDVSEFRTDEFLAYCSEYTVTVTKQDIVNIIVYELNDLDRTNRDYHKIKQKYLDQLLTLASESSTNTISEYEI